MFRYADFLENTCTQGIYKRMHISYSSHCSDIIVHVTVFAGVSKKIWRLRSLLGINCKYVMELYLTLTHENSFFSWILDFKLLAFSTLHQMSIFLFFLISWPNWGACCFSLSTLCWNTHSGLSFPINPCNTEFQLIFLFLVSQIPQQYPITTQHFHSMSHSILVYYCWYNRPP